MSSLGESRTKFRAGVPVPSRVSSTQRWTVVHWPLIGGCRPLREIEGPPFVWHDIWTRLGEFVEGTYPANEIEICVLPKELTENESIEVDVRLRPGIYLLPKSFLVDIELKRNNRGRLIPKNTVALLLEQSAQSGYMVPMPTWPTHTAGDRPPDLFLAQKTSFDSRFSPTAGSLSWLE